MPVVRSTKHQQQAEARDLKHRVLTCLHKLSDRDTHSSAASELESIAKTLSPNSLPSFITSISSTDTSDKSPVRRQCLRLISVVAEHHGDSLSPYLSKVLSAIVRRLRDPDSAVRSACVATTLSISSNLSVSQFGSIAKPYLEALFTEQDVRAQSSAALCLAAVIEGSSSPDVASLRRLLPRLEKLAKCESFKAKAAILALIGSVVGAEGVLSGGKKDAVNNLVVCLVEFLGNEDWAARKAAAEALTKVVVVEKESLSECKASCLKTFEAKRYDKVKAVRETMNQLIEAWKEIPSLSDEVSPLPQSHSSSNENASDGRYPPISYTTPQVSKRNILNSPTTRTPSTVASTARKRTPLCGNDNKIAPPMFRKLDRKKPSDPKVEVLDSSGMMVSDDSLLNRDEQKKQFAKPIKALFKGGSRVVPYSDASVVVSNETGGDMCRSQTECDDLSLIRKQLVQIENQQSNLLDLLQTFIGSSQTGMQSLEARVHGLELALDEISFDLAMSTGRMSHSGATCCKLPGTEFLCSRLWRKAEPRPSICRVPASGGTRSGTTLSSSILHKNGRGVIVNPLAKIPSRSLGFPEVSSSGAVNNTGK